MLFALTKEGTLYNVARRIQTPFGDYSIITNITEQFAGRGSKYSQSLDLQGV